MPRIEVDEKLVRSRAEYFVAAGTLIGAQDPFSNCEFEVQEDDALVLSEAYYLLNGWYKKVRLQNIAEPTKNSKIAAFQVLSIAVVCPFRPTLPPKAPTITTMMANSIFAMKCACATMEDYSFDKRGFAYKDRFYQGIRNLKFKPLEKYLELTVAGKRSLFEPFELELSRDELVQIENKINMFEVLEKVIGH